MPRCFLLFERSFFANFVAFCVMIPTLLSAPLPGLSGRRYRRPAFLNSLNSSRLPLVLLGAVTLLSWSCATPEVPRLVTFKEADFARTSGTGSGTVAGQAFTVLTDKSVKTAQIQSTVFT
jgi:hypothetical protein